MKKKIACAAALVLACATVSGLAADLDGETKADLDLRTKLQDAEMKLQDMQAKLRETETKLRDTQTKLREMQAKTQDTAAKKPRETPAKRQDAETKPQDTQMKKPPDKQKTAQWTPWDIAFGSALMTEFNFRGISASDHRPAAMAYFEPRYNFTDSLQAYAHVESDSITLPNHAAVAVEMYAGLRPTFDRLTLDFGFWQHWLPGGRCVNFQAVGGLCGLKTVLYVNAVPGQLSYWEVFAKATYHVDSRLSFGGRVAWTPSILDSGAEATYVAGWAKYVLPPILPPHFGWFISAEAGYWDRSMSPYPSYTNWNAGLAFTWKQLTLDLRYSSTDKRDCDQAVTAAVHDSNRCGATFVGKLSVDMTKENLK
jgi:Bacterial protein of unknown function (Gcw_chp)